MALFLFTKKILAGEPIKEFVDPIEKELGITAQKEFFPLQPGDVLVAYADVEDLVMHIGFKPSTAVAEGMKKFINWYKLYYKID